MPKRILDEFEKYPVYQLFTVDQMVGEPIIELRDWQVKEMERRRKALENASQEYPDDLVERHDRIMAEFNQLQSELMEIYEQRYAGRR